MARRSLLPACVAFLVLFAAASAPAGGSVDFVQDALPVLQKFPTLIEFIQKTLDVEEVGWSPNGGRSFTNPVGDRILPYGFRAKPKGQAGIYTVLLLIQDNGANNGIHLQVVPINSQGVPEGMGQPPAAPNPETNVPASNGN